MNNDRIKEIIDRIPIGLLVVAYLGYTANEFYQFEKGDNSPLVMKRREVISSRDQKAKLEVKLKELNDFIRTLETKKIELRGLAQELQNMKGTLSESLDVPAFMKMTTTEARKVGMTVLSLSPGASVNKEYYAEETFTMTFRGVYVQLLAFLERLSNVTQIVRVENFDIKPIGPSNAKFVELEGKLEIKAYRYLGSKADTLGKEGASNGMPQVGQGKSL